MSEMAQNMPFGTDGADPATTADASAARQALLAPLVARMAQGDEAALESFYEATAARANGLAMRICGVAALAEEVTGDAYFQAWTDAIRYDASRGKVLTWLLMIVRSRAIDAVRGRDSAVLHEAPETLIDEAAENRLPSVEDLLESAQSDATVAAMFGQLSAVQRQLIALAFYRGMSHSEIVAHTGLPLGTVKTNIRRGLSKLKDALVAAESRTR